jgi:nucleoside-diphosphate kinase
MERTLIAVKPDGVKRGLVGRVISRFEDKGFKIVDLRLLTMGRAQAETFYSPHAQKPFFPELVRFITSGPVIAAILEGDSAVEVVRRMIGSTKGAEALPGTVRGRRAAFPELRRHPPRGADAASGGAEAEE